jgi:hypothetical protein
MLCLLGIYGAPKGPQEKKRHRHLAVKFGTTPQFFFSLVPTVFFLLGALVL